MRAGFPQPERNPLRIDENGHLVPVRQHLWRHDDPSADVIDLDEELHHRMPFGRSRPEAAADTAAGVGLGHPVVQRVALADRPVEQPAMESRALVRITREDLKV